MGRRKSAPSKPAVTLKVGRVWVVGLLQMGCGETELYRLHIFADKAGAKRNHHTRSRNG